MIKLSKPKPESTFKHNGVQLHHSKFNLIWLSELSISPKVIFDIGTFDGGDAVRFKQAYPEAEVYAFEADPGRAGASRQNMKDLDIKFFEIAVTEKSGQIGFYRSFNDRVKDYHAQGSLLKHTEGTKQSFPFIHQDKNPTTVQAISIQDFCKFHKIWEVDLLHMDVEGAEGMILKGLGQVIRPKVLFFEMPLTSGWEGSVSHDHLNKYLLELGYKLIQNFESDRLYLYDPGKPVKAKQRRSATVAYGNRTGHYQYE